MIHINIYFIFNNSYYIKDIFLKDTTENVSVTKFRPDYIRNVLSA